MIRGIRKKFLVFFIIAILLLCILGFFLWKETKKTIANKFGRDFAEQYISLQKEEISNVFNSELNLLKALASSDPMRNWLRYEYNASLKISAVRKLQEYRKYLRSGNIYAISYDSGHYYYIDKQLESPTIGYTKTFSPADPEAEKYFGLLKSNKVYSIETSGKSESGLTEVWLNVAVKYDGKPEGVIGTNFELSSYFAKLLHSDKKGVSSFILDRNGNIFIGNDEGKTYGPGDKNVLNLMSPKNKTSVKKIMQDAAENPGNILIKNMKINSSPHVVALSYLPSANWFIFSMVNADGIFATDDIIIPIAFIVSGTILIFLFFGLYTDRSIIKPLKELTAGAVKIGEGDYDTKFVVDENDEIGTLKQIFNRMSTEIRLKTHIKDLEDKMQQKTQDLAKSRVKISFLLNSSGEGFLQFNSDMVIDSEFSKECLSIFGEDIAGKEIHKLLYADDKEKRQLFDRVITSVFKHKQKFLKEIMIGLLPEEAVVNNKFYALRFKLGKDDNIVLIMRDITEQKNLSRKVEDERKKLNLVVEYVRDEYAIRELIKDFFDFCENVDSYSAEVVYRKLHTFKGNFLQKGFINIPGCIHEEETYIQNFFNKKQNKLNINTSRLCNSLKKDTDILRENLGEDVFDNATIKIDLDKLKRLTQRAKKVDDGLYRELSDLFKKPLSEYLEGFGKVVDMVAEKEEKMVNYKIICDPELKVYPERFRDFFNVFYHIIVNAVVHGIEKPDERASKGKKETGIIQCKAVKVENFLLIEVSDNGKGIDMNSVREKFGRQAESNDYGLLFENGVTTREKADNFTGRGAGLGAVKMEVEKMKGSIRINSKKDVGTKVFIKIPIKE